MGYIWDSVKIITRAFGHSILVTFAIELPIILGIVIITLSLMESNVVPWGGIFLILFGVFTRTLIEKNKEMKKKLDQLFHR